VPGRDRVEDEVEAAGDPTDLPTFIAVTACLSAIAFFGCLIPGLKAAMIDPAIALRAE